MNQRWVIITEVDEGEFRPVAILDYVWMEHFEYVFSPMMNKWMWCLKNGCVHDNTVACTLILNLQTTQLDFRHSWKIATCEWLWWKLSAYNCWKVICECVLTVILRSVRIHDLDNDSYQHCVWQCGWSMPAYFVHIYVSVYTYSETVCVSGSTGALAN